MKIGNEYRFQIIDAMLDAVLYNLLNVTVNRVVTAFSKSLLA
jgi:hypothetical protein